MGDLELWKMVRQGDKVAFEELYHRYYSLLFNYALRLKFDSEEIKDCLQEVFVRIYMKRSELPEISSVKSYLYRCLINALLNKTKGFKSKTISLDELNDFSIDDSGIEKLFEKNDAELARLQLLKEGFKQLSSKQKHILYLRFIHELSWDELAQMFEMSSHSCMNLVGRAITKLRTVVNILYD